MLFSFAQASCLPGCPERRLTVKKKTTYAAIALTLLIGLALTSAAWGQESAPAAENTQTPSARDIIDKAGDKQFPENSIIDMTMILINKKGKKRERTLEIKRKTFEDGESKSVAYFLAPKDIRGTAFLVWEHKKRANDQFIYLPTMKALRRIASSQKNQSFFGSDFSYADMETQDIDDSVHKMLPQQEMDGKSYWVIESIPKPKSDSAYSKRVSWVEKKELIPEKVEFYDKKGRLLKTMKVNRTGLVGKEVLPLDFTMENVQKKHKTEIVSNEVKVDQDIPDKEFTKRAIQR